MARIAINGFGRIGRQMLKAAWNKRGFNIVAINDLGDAESLAYLLKYDSNYGIWDKEVSFGPNYIMIDRKKIPVLNESDPAQLPWKKHRVDVVVEATGRFTDEEAASLHLNAGAKRVVISAPGKGDIPTFVLGVNQNEMDGKKQKVVSNASCTTNCTSPVMKILNDTFGVEKAMLSTVHGYTAAQNLVDGPHRKDPRRGRAAAENMIPTTTGAAKATVKTLPDLEGRFDGIAIRVPVPTVSLSDMTVLLKKDVTVDEVNAAFKKAVSSRWYKGIVAVTDEPLVSSDFVGSPYSATVDLQMTRVVNGNLVKIVAWYDNEWGYANRLAEFIINHVK